MTGRLSPLADEWEAIGKQRGMSEDENAIAGDRQGAIEVELATTPAETMADIIAKARILAEWERQGFSSNAQIARSVLADLTRMAGGGAS